MTIFVLFFAELMTLRYGNFGGDSDHDAEVAHASRETPSSEGESKLDHNDVDRSRAHSHIPGEDHDGHRREHKSNDLMPVNGMAGGFVPESYAAQMTAVFILEFGVIFHSIFIGLTLAVAGDEFNTRKLLMAHTPGHY